MTFNAVIKGTRILGWPTSPILMPAQISMVWNDKLFCCCSVLPEWLLSQRKAVLKKIKFWQYHCLLGPTYLLSMCLSCYGLNNARHNNPVLITNRSSTLTIHKGRIFWKTLLEKTFLNFKKWVKNIQTVGYNGARKVYKIRDKDIIL